MAKNKSKFINAFFTASIIFSSHCMAEFDNSIGFGVQYAGVFGWQGSWTQDNLHTRIALGLVGATAGVDVNLNEHISVGATLGAIALARVSAFNLNYYPNGQYTQSWRVGLDVGTFRTNILGENSEHFTSISFGYSFK
jgi:hypothetical protein